LRLDKFLKVSRIIKQRGKSKFMCDNSHVKVNGNCKKPCYQVNEGDIIEIDDLKATRKYQVLEVPPGKGNVSREKSRTLTELQEEHAKEWL